MTAPDNYTSASGISYSFNNIPLGFAEAEAICNTQCGHLAAYPNLPEQNDVEQYYIGRVSAVTQQPARPTRAEQQFEQQHKLRCTTPNLLPAPCHPCAGPDHSRLPHQLLDGPVSAHGAGMARLFVGDARHTGPCQPLPQLGLPSAGARAQ